MAYTEVSFEDASDIIMAADLPNLVNIEKLSGGWANSNYKLTLTDNSKIVLKIWDEQSLDQVSYLLSITTYLSDKKFTLMSHLSASNVPSDISNKTQFEHFDSLCQKLNPDILKSIANTGCVINFPDKSMDWVRVGIGIFGGYIGNNELQTAMTLRSPIINIRKINKGQRVGYDGRAEATQDMKIATVYCGYADGLPNHIKDGTKVFINNVGAEIFGKVSMDVTTVDVSHIPDCEIGDWCEFFSPNHSINNLASSNNLISYDLMIRIKSRVKRIYKKL